MKTSSAVDMADLAPSSLPLAIGFDTRFLTSILVSCNAFQFHKAVMVIYGAFRADRFEAVRDRTMIDHKVNVDVVCTDSCSSDGVSHPKPSCIWLHRLL